MENSSPEIPQSAPEQDPITALSQQTTEGFFKGISNLSGESREAVQSQREEAIKRFIEYRNSDAAVKKDWDWEQGEQQAFQRSVVQKGLVAPEFFPKPKSRLQSVLEKVRSLGGNKPKETPQDQ